LAASKPSCFQVSLNELSQSAAKMGQVREVVAVTTELIRKSLDTFLLFLSLVGLQFKFGNHTLLRDRHHSVCENPRHARTFAVPRQPRVTTRDKTL
jgi:hypothetical protein